MGINLPFLRGGPRESDRAPAALTSFLPPWVGRFVLIPPVGENRTNEPLAEVLLQALWRRGQHQFVSMSSGERGSGRASRAVY